MDIIASTSNLYHHVLPVFFYLFEKYWGEEIMLVGYDKPKCTIPAWCEWVSLGKQGTKNDYAKDMRGVFEFGPDNFVYLMEDTFIRQALNKESYELCKVLSLRPDVGRISLTNNSYKFYTDLIRTVDGIDIYKTQQNSDYRLSLQPAIWNREYLCKHLKDGMSPWDVENQNGTLMTFSEPYYINIALAKHAAPLTSNEGIRRHNLYRYDFTGFAEEDIIHLKSIGYNHNPWTR